MCVSKCKNYTQEKNACANCIAIQARLKNFYTTQCNQLQFKSHDCLTVKKKRVFDDTVCIRQSSGISHHVIIDTFVESIIQV